MYVAVGMNYSTGGGKLIFLLGTVFVNKEETTVLCQNSSKYKHFINFAFYKDFPQLNLYKGNLTYVA